MSFESSDDRPSSSEIAASPKKNYTKYIKRGSTLTPEQIEKQINHKLQLDKSPSIIIESVEFPKDTDISEKVTPRLVQP